MEYRELMDTMKALCAASNDLWEAENCLQDADSDHAAARDKWLRSINKLDECRDALIPRKREVRRQPELRVVASNDPIPGVCHEKPGTDRLAASVFSNRPFSPTDGAA